MNKYVVYTVIVGSYDEILQPLVIDERFDYILFCDHCEESSIGIWQVRSTPVDYHDSFRLSRYPKVFPCRLLSEYDASLYIDGNLQIASRKIYDRFIELFEQNVEWGGVAHCWRDCIYEEMTTLLNFHWVHDYEIVNWYCKLKNANFPEHLGLLENNVIFRIHNDRVNLVCSEWWKTLESECKRDQFSLMYCLWLHPLSVHHILPIGESAKSSECFIYRDHKPHQRVQKLSFNEHLRTCLWSVSDNGGKPLTSLFSRFCRQSNPIMGLYLWEFSAIFKYGFRAVTKVIRLHVKNDESNN